MSNGARQFPETGGFAPFCANAEFGRRNKAERAIAFPINTRKLYEEVTN